MASKSLIESSLKKSKRDELRGSLNSAFFQDICETALHYIELSEKEKNKVWVLVSDRLPETELAIPVLVTIKHYHSGNHYVKEAQYWNNKGFAIYPPDEEDEKIINGIVAWMEMPSPCTKLTASVGEENV